MDLVKVQSSHILQQVHRPTLKFNISPKKINEVLLHPCSRHLKKNERVLALVVSIALGILLIGLAHAICAITYAIMRKQGLWQQQKQQSQDIKPQKVFLASILSQSTEKHESMELKPLSPTLSVPALAPISTMPDEKPPVPIPQVVALPVSVPLDEKPVLDDIASPRRETSVLDSPVSVPFEEKPISDILAVTFEESLVLDSLASPRGETPVLDSPVPVPLEEKPISDTLAATSEEKPVLDDIAPPRGETPVLDGPATVTCTLTASLPETVSDHLPLDNAERSPEQEAADRDKSKGALHTTQLLLAECILHGHGRLAQTPWDAIPMLEQAGEIGNAEEKRMAAVLLNAICVDDESLQKARKWMVEAAADGDSIALHQRDVEYFHQQLNLGDVQGAFAKIKASADSGEKHACVWIANAYAKGIYNFNAEEVVGQHLTKAVEYFDKAIAQGDSEAMFAKALLLFQSKNFFESEVLPESDPRHLLDLMTAAANLGHLDALCSLAELYQKGSSELELNPDSKKAFIYLETAFALGSVEAAEELAKLYMASDYDQSAMKSIKCFNLLAKYGHWEKLEEVVLETNKDDVALEDLDILLHVAEFYLRRYQGLRVDDDRIKAQEYYERAFKKGSSEAVDGLRILSSESRSEGILGREVQRKMDQIYGILNTNEWRGSFRSPKNNY